MVNQQFSSLFLFLYLSYSFSRSLIPPFPSPRLTHHAHPLNISSRRHSAAGQNLATVPLSPSPPLLTPPSPQRTAAGQNLTTVPLTVDTITEVVRLYLIATGWTDEDSLISMQTLPVWAVKPSQKASLLGHICNELLGSALISNKLEDNQFQLDNMRRERWNLECQIRK